MKALQHFNTITKHKILVMKECFRVGLYRQGLLHDLSKYSPSEFLVGCRYYQGTRSPNNAEREDRGYSSAWLHHKGRNKHHSEYWIDEASPNVIPVMPYKYAAEMLCDKLAAGIVYEGKNWTKEYELAYWNKEKNIVKVNDKIKDFITSALEDVARDGIDKALTKKNIKEKYEKYCR